MAESVTIWSIDRLAASALLADLKRVEPSDAELSGTEPSGTEPSDMVELVAEHFARHRVCAHLWAAERVLATVVRKLEATSVQLFGRKSAEWTEGFRSAEAQLIGVAARDLLETNVGKARSTGQVLRSLVVRAKQGDESVTL